MRRNDGLGYKAWIDWITFLATADTANADLLSFTQLLAVGALGRRTTFLLDLVQGSFTIVMFCNKEEQQRVSQDVRLVDLKGSERGLTTDKGSIG